MRLRSQDRAVDVPYELSAIQVKRSNRETQEDDYLIRAVMGGEIFKLGIFKDKAKAIKVMDEIAARATRQEVSYQIPYEDDV
jgi:hypothetical protein